MAVMRWKCSLLSPEKRTELEDWISEQQKSKEKVRTLLWSEEASEHGDDLFAENTYVQRYAVCIFLSSMSIDPVIPYSAIDGLASTVQQAIKEIERQTGWKAMVILSGLEPRAGKISSHL